jgi:hypothetical protein
VQCMAPYDIITLTRTFTQTIEYEFRFAECEQVIRLCNPRNKFHSKPLIHPEATCIQLIDEGSSCSDRHKTLGI